MIHEDVHYVTKELLEFSNLIRRNPRHAFREYGVMVEQKISESSAMSLLGRDSALNVAVQKVRRSSNSLFDWLTEI